MVLTHCRHWRSPDNSLLHGKISNLALSPLPPVNIPRFNWLKIVPFLSSGDVFCEFLNELLLVILVLASGIFREQLFFYWQLHKPRTQLGQLVPKFLQKNKFSLHHTQISTVDAWYTSPSVVNYWLPLPSPTALLYTHCCPSHSSKLAG